VSRNLLQVPVPEKAFLAVNHALVCRDHDSGMRGPDQSQAFNAAFETLYFGADLLADMGSDTVVLIQPDGTGLLLRES